MAINSEIVEHQRSVDNEIRDLVLQAREHQRIIADRENAIYEIKQHLARLVETRGTGWSDDDGYALLAQEEANIVYNATALDELTLSDPEQFGWLREHRSEIAIPQRVQIH